MIGHEIENYNTTGAFGAARATRVIDKDLTSISKDLTANDHVLTYLPLKNKSEYENAYENWKKNLLNILNNKL